MPNRIPTYRHPAIGGAPGHDSRPSAAKRHYDHKWRKKRAEHLRKEPTCRLCRAEGRAVAATVVDHITRLRRGGADDSSNFQSLCESCHNRKTGSGN